MDKWSGEGDAGMEKGDSGGRNSLRIRYTASTSLPWINLSSRRYLHVRPSYFLSLSLPPLFFFRFENETINEWKSILFHLIRAPDKNQVIKKRNFPNSILKETISPRAPSCIPYAQIRFPKQLLCRSQSLFRGILSPLKFIFNHFSAHVAGNQITG